MAAVKVCANCEEIKSIVDFHKSKNEPYGVGHECKVCAKKRFSEFREKNRQLLRGKHRKYAKDNPAIVLAWGRKSHYKKKFGLTYEQVIEMWTIRNKECDICGKEMILEGRKSNPACIDHDHETKRIRGLLCSNCNFALGLLDDNPENAMSAAKYLLEDTQHD